MPLPSPAADEQREKWMQRCMANPTMNSEFPDSGQRFAVCQSIWEEKKDAPTWDRNLPKS